MFQKCHNRSKKNCVSYRMLKKSLVSWQKCIIRRLWQRWKWSPIEKLHWLIVQQFKKFFFQHTIGKTLRILKGPCYQKIQWLWNLWACGPSGSAILTTDMILWITAWSHRHFGNIQKHPQLLRNWAHTQWCDTKLKSVLWSGRSTFQIV